MTNDRLNQRFAMMDAYLRELARISKRWDAPAEPERDDE
jgi:hypothetical protein